MLSQKQKEVKGSTAKKAKFKLTKEEEIQIGLDMIPMF